MALPSRPSCRRRISAFVSGVSVGVHYRGAIRIRVCRTRKPRVPRATALRTGDSGHRRALRVGALATWSVIALIANRITHRMQLSGAMKYYTIFIAQGATLAYTVVYGAILFVRVWMHMVPRSQIRSALSKRQLQIFASIGVAEGVVFNVQLYAAARLPGVLIVVLQQAILPFVMGASTLMLGRRYSSAQLLGVACVIAGVLTSTVSTATASAASGSAAATVAIAAAVYGASYALLAYAVVLKEDALQGGTFSGQQFDVFVVNWFGSAFQCLTTVLLLPVTLAIATTQPMQYLRNGLRTFLTAPYMPWLSVLYIVCNLTYNIAALYLTKTTNASVALLSNLFAVPVVALVFCLKLPLLTPTPFSWFIYVGLVIIIAGVLLYNYGGSGKIANSKQ